MNVEQTVQANLDAYNQRDIEGFMSSISNDIEVFSLGDSQPSLSGSASVRSFYAELFTSSPGLNSKILQRIIIGNTVIDHESILGRNGADEAIELVLVYEVREGKIYRITVIRN